MTTTTAEPTDVARFLANASILKWAAQASAECGVWPSVVLAQWADETAWGTSKAFAKGHNFAGVSKNGQVIAYANYPEGLAGYVWCLKLALYDPVRAAHDAGADAQALALGASPWAAGHYIADGSTEPGSALVAIIADNDLTKFDALDGTATPQPPAPVDPPEPGTTTYAKLDAVTATRIVFFAFSLVLNRVPTSAEFLTWCDALEGGTREPANLIEELTLEPQSFVSPLIVRARA